MAFVNGETCLDEVVIKIITQYDEYNIEETQIKVEISHDNGQDKELHIFSNDPQLCELDLDKLVQEYYENHWDGGSSWMQKYGDK